MVRMYGRRIENILKYRRRIGKSGSNENTIMKTLSTTVGLQLFWAQPTMFERHFELHSENSLLGELHFETASVAYWCVDNRRFDNGTLDIQGGEVSSETECDPPGGWGK
jgi:hypothetical protein